MTAKNEPEYTLDKLIEYIGNDKDAIKNMLSIFLTSTCEIIEMLENANQSDNYDDISKNAHKLKPNIDIFGIQVLHDPVRKLELFAKEKKNTEEIPALVAFVKLNMLLICEQIKTDFQL